MAKGTVPPAAAREQHAAGFSGIHWELSSKGIDVQGDESEAASPPAGTPTRTMLARCHFMRRASAPGAEPGRRECSPTTVATPPGIYQDVFFGDGVQHSEPSVCDRPHSTPAEAPPAECHPAFGGAASSSARGGQRRRQRGSGGLEVEVPGTPRQDAPSEDRPSSTPAKATLATCHFLRKALLGAKGGQQREDGSKAAFTGIEAAESASRDRPASSPAKTKFATCHFMRKALMGTKNGQQHDGAPAVEFMGIERELAPEHVDHIRAASTDDARTTTKDCTWDAEFELEVQPVSTSPKTPLSTCHSKRKSLLSPKNGKRHDGGPPAEPTVVAEPGTPSEERRPRHESTPRGQHLGLAARPKAVHPSPDPVEAPPKEQLLGPVTSAKGATARYAVAAVPEGRSASAGLTDGSAPAGPTGGFAHPLPEHGPRSSSVPLCQPRRGVKKGQLPKDLKHEQHAPLPNPVMKAFTDPVPHVEQEIKVVPLVAHAARLPETGVELRPARKLVPPVCAQAPAPPSRYISAGSVPFCRRRHSALTAIKC